MDGFTPIPDALRDCEDLTLQEVYLIAHVARRCGARGCRESNAKIASMLRYRHPNTAGKLINDLASQGYLKTQYHSDGTETARVIWLGDKSKPFFALNPQTDPLNPQTDPLNVQTDPLNVQTDPPSTHGLTPLNPQVDHKIQEIQDKDTHTDNVCGADAVKVLEYLGSVTGNKYGHSPYNLNPIADRLRAGATVEQMQRVIDTKWEQVKGTQYNYLMETKTLFGAKWEEYLRQVQTSHTPKPEPEQPKLKPLAFVPYRKKKDVIQNDRSK